MLKHNADREGKLHNVLEWNHVSIVNLLLEKYMRLPIS